MSIKFDLASKVLGLFDSLPLRTFDAVRARDWRDTGARIQVPREALADLIAEVEASYPGILERYRKAHREQH